MAQQVQKDSDYILNYCTKYLARRNVLNGRYGDVNDNQTIISEAWRFPIISSSGSEDQNTSDENTYSHNEVTFIYADIVDNTNKKIQLIGTFNGLYETIDMENLRLDGETTGYYHVTLVLPVAQEYRYRFIVDGMQTLDPINPQRKTLQTNKVWSKFFTDFYTRKVSFEGWELKLLKRMTDQVLPFRTTDADIFLNNFYNGISQNEKKQNLVYSLDGSVGEESYIDNICAREENHRLIDYKICISQIDKVLRQRNPFVDSWKVPKELILELYDEMVTGNVNGWDYSKYKNPTFFLNLLRRHAITGAFSHPKYGGNVMGSGWAYLQERYKDEKTKQTDFDWRAALEQPLGTNQEYLG